ncbi:hypothetical protein [Anaerorhabdus sp.]|uniref:hypothetical protein n=1 Tax=Anaerorhabdus sp. TaxID=1872524 RepID=UPI002FCAF9CE
MEFIDNELSKLKNEGYDFLEVKAIYENIVNMCIENGVKFRKGTQEQMFLNHILVLSKRIVSRDLIEEMELYGIDELSKFAIDKANTIVGSVLSNYHLEMNKTESFLIATHIEMNKEEEENGK